MMNLTNTLFFVPAHNIACMQPGVDYLAGATLDGYIARGVHGGDFPGQHQAASGFTDRTSDGPSTLGGSLSEARREIRLPSRLKLL